MTRSIRRDGEAVSPRTQPSLTSHRQHELKMAGQQTYPDPSPSTQRPRLEFVRLQDPQTGQERPAVVVFPAGSGSSYCVVHTAEDYDRHLKCQTQRRYEEYIEPRTEPWDADRSIKTMVYDARDGEYDDIADMMGFDSVISLVMHVAEDSEDISAPSPTNADKVEVSHG